MKISALIQGLSIATVLLVAGTPAYGASIFIQPPVAQLDDDPILEIAGRPGDVITWRGFMETTGLTAPLQSWTLFASRISNEIDGFEATRTEKDAQLYPSLVEPITFDPNTDTTTLTGTRNGPPGSPPNSVLNAINVRITLGSELINDGQADYRIGILSAIDANGTDVTALFQNGVPAQFEGVQEFEVQTAPVHEPSTFFGLILAGGFGVFLRKQNRKVLERVVW